MRLQYIAACIAAFLFAALVPALAYVGYAGVFAGYDRSIGLLPLVLVITLAHTVAAGLPLFLIFRAKGWINALSCTGGGFLVGAIPFGLFTLLAMLDRGSSTSVNGVPFVINGVPTLAGWLSYGRTLLILGLTGALGGFVFWGALRLLGGAKAGKTNHPLRVSSATGVAAVAILFTGAVFAIPSITRDRSCHNTLRDGRSSISPQTSFRVEIDIDQWPKLTQAVENVGSKHSLSFRNRSEIQPGVQTLYLSVCSERGFNISVAEQRWAARAPFDNPIDKFVSVDVYEMAPGAGWQMPTRDLVTALEALWPSKVQFKDSSGRAAPKPKELQARD